MALEDRLHTLLGHYMSAPTWLRSLAGHAYGVLPTRVRHGARYEAFAQDVRRSPIEAPWHEVEQRLEATLAAASGVPAYAEHAALLRDTQRPALQRLRALPTVSKLDYKAALSSYVHHDARPGDLLKMFTGGSTAHPMAFYLHRHVSRPKETAYVHDIERSLLGTAPGDWTLSLRGRTVRSAASGGPLWSAEPIKRQLLFSADHLEARYMPDYVQELARLRPRSIQAFPSALYPLARWLLAHPCPAFSEQVRGILLTSENVYAFQEALLREVFPNARLVRHYGHSERVLCAVSRGLSSDHDFFPLYGLPELLDAEGAPITTPGVVGEIVGTSFDNHVMPFVRYRTGDMGVWREAPRYDGTVRFRLQRIEGRLQEFVVCRDRRLVSITTLGAAHFEQLRDVDTIQFEQTKPGQVLLKVVTREPLSPRARADIARAVEHKTQGGCEVTVTEVAALARTARGKHRMLIQHLDLAPYLGAAVRPGDTPDTPSPLSTLVCA